MIWETAISKMTGTKYPIIMGAFMILGRAEFAAAFSNAGGFGMIAAINFTNSDDFEKELEKMNKLTEKPYGVNFSVMPPEILKKGGKGRNEESYLEFIEIALGAGVKVFTTSAYKAPKIWDKIHKANCKCIHKCATLKHALSAEKLGVDGITLVGLEGTGFKNPYQNTTLVNITMAKRLLKLPIVAAGGIGDARGFLSALAMGAEAVCFGSAILATKESPASKKWKEKILKQDIFDEKFYKKIYHFELKDSPIGSMAIGHLNKTISIKEFIDNIINDAEGILQSWGFESDKFSTL
jgi:NAD(P)H-dependent flavin oxidoreductase YrpB (nitropropane dioxygenase family)